MAVLQNIREKCGVLVIVIVGLALLAFLLGDFLSSGRIGHGDDSVIAKINGSKVDYSEWSANYNNHRLFYEVAQQGRNIDANTERSLRESAWNDILNTYVWNKYYEEVGLGISDEELEDLLYGPKHAHNIIVQNFGLQKNENGEYDTKAPKNFFDNAESDPNYEVIAEYWKKAIKEDQISSKYGNMVSKGFYTPTALAKMYYEDQTNTVDFAYAYREYSAIKDEDITVTDKDMQAYYDMHKKRFVEDQDNRDLEYVVFDIVPSESDIAEIMKNTEELRTEMSALTDNYLSFAQLNSSNSRPEDRYNRMYKDDSYLNKKDAEAIGFTEEFFNSEVGTTSEVRRQGDYFLFGRILETANRPDSVNASHILIRPTDSITMEMCKATADSIANILRSTKADSAAFAAMAIQYSQDPGSKNNGGSLGDFTEGTMVPEFNDACFANAAGTIQVIESPYGVHIIKINSQTKPVRKIKVAVLDQEIKFSEDTYEAAFHASNKFLAESKTAEDFDNNATKLNLNVRMANRITDMSDNVIPGIDNGREIVRWAFNEDRKIGDISNVFESSARDKFLVVKLSKIREKGFTPFEDTKEVIEPEVRKQMKAEKMMAEMNGMNVEAVAQKFGAKTDTLTNINFSSFSLPGLGLIEPKVNAVALNSEVNAVSAPIDGNNGVYVIKVLNKTAAPEKQDFENDKLAKMQEYMRSYSYRMNNAVKKIIKMDDRRAKFF
ncbi:MAG: peptidylprolyl isomerase [Bacteroidales bacterium]|nr:peptidylprolyl isomerase [Bacteroidales bacterium]